MPTRSIPLVIFALLFCCAASPVSDRPLLRREIMIIVDTQGQAPPAVKLVSQRIGARVTPLRYDVLDEKSQLVTRGIVGLDAQQEVRLPATTRMCLFQLDSGLNGYRFDTRLPYSFIASKTCVFHVYAFAGRLYFYVPQGCKGLKIWALCQSPSEGAALSVKDPEGNAAGFVGGELPRWEGIAITPTPNLCGRAWSLEISEYKGLALDDVELYIAGDAPPLLSLNPDAVVKIAELLSSAPAKPKEGDAR